jgi:hypothetical protein
MNNLSNKSLKIIMKCVAAVGALLGIATIGIHFFIGISGLPYWIEIVYLGAMVWFWFQADKV